MPLAIALVVLCVGAARASEQAHEAEHEYHTHHISVLLGAAIEPRHDEIESGFTYGLDYEFPPHRLFGIGALIEFTAGDLRGGVVMAPFFLHPWRGLALVVAPRAEFRDYRDAAFLVRVGTAYLFPIGRFSLGPEFSVDIVDREPIYVTGLVLGVGF